jgi:peptidyl-prolyl cis-trans isomerase C
MKTLIREPLVHFLLLGGILFGIYRLPARNVSATDNRITITAGDIEQMRAIFFRQRQRPPTEEELKGFINTRVDEEVLYREALAMGLDRNDTIVRRRLAQKLEFLTDDLSDPGNPAEAELAAFFKEQGERYQMPSRLSFVHVYFSAGKRGKRVEQDARNDLARLHRGASTLAIDAMGDAFLLEHEYKEMALDEIDKIFGSGFAAELTKVPLRQWQGPIASGYGMHLVKVDKHEGSHAMAFDLVREQVKRDWLDVRRRQLKEAAFKELRERYEVVVDDNAVRAAMVAHRGNIQERDQ